MNSLEQSCISSCDGLGLDQVHTCLEDMLSFARRAPIRFQPENQLRVIQRPRGLHRGWHRALFTLVQLHVTGGERLGLIWLARLSHVFFHSLAGISNTVQAIRQAVVPHRMFTGASDTSTYNL